MPSISVIVPVYQAEKYVKKCVESVTKQTFSDWELLLVDDGCTDGSPAICDACAAEDDRIRVFHRKKNAGVSEARNLGLREAKGDYIAFLDVDDRFEFRALETLWCLREQTGADTVGCAHLNLYADGKKYVEPLLPAGVYDAQGVREKIVAPLLGAMGLDTPAKTALAVMAIGAGAMTVSHANDSYFWVVTNFGQMTPEQGYKTQTTLTLVLGLSAMVGIFILSLIF